MEKQFDTFFKANAGLVKKVAIKVHARVLAMGASLPYEDIEQDVSVVMMRAWEKFDPTKGFKFSTYFYRAAFNDMNRIIEPYARECTELGLMSMSAVADEEGDEFAGDSIIDGGHATPEQVLEAKQLLSQIQERVSPLAYSMLELMIDPPELMEREWQKVNEVTGANRAEMTIGFVTNYVQAITGMPVADVRRAATEITNLRKELYV